MARNEVEPQCELGRQLEKERENRGLTKTAWLIELRTYRPTYINWMRGAEPERVNMERIAEVLGVPLPTVYEWVWFRDNPAFREVIGRSTQPRPRLAYAA